MSRSKKPNLRDFNTSCRLVSGCMVAESILKELDSEYTLCPVDINLTPIARQMKLGRVYRINLDNNTRLLTKVRKDVFAVCMFTTIQNAMESMSMFRIKADRTNIKFEADVGEGAGQHRMETSNEDPYIRGVGIHVDRKMICEARYYTDTTADACLLNREELEREGIL